MPTIVILLLLTLHTVNGKNLGNFEARQNIEGNPNTRPNVVMQSVILGKKKLKTQEEPDEMIDRLDEILSEGDYNDYDDRRHLKKLYKIIDRIKSKQIETFKKYKPRRYRYEDSEEEICRESEDSEEMPVIRKYESDEDEFRKRRWNRPKRICECERKPKFEKLSDKRRHKRYRKPEEWPGEGKRSTSHIPQDILYIPRFGKSD